MKFAETFCGCGHPPFSATCQRQCPPTHPWTCYRPKTPCSCTKAWSQTNNEKQTLGSRSGRGHRWTEHAPSAAAKCLLLVVSLWSCALYCILGWPKFRSFWNINFAQSPMCSHGPPFVLHVFGFSEFPKMNMLEIAKVLQKWLCSGVPCKSFWDGASKLKVTLKLTEKYFCIS